MKKLLTFLTLLTLFFGVSWAAETSITVNILNYGGLSDQSYVSSPTNATIDNVAFRASQFVPKTGQVRGNQTSVTSNFNISNTTAVPGNITKIELITEVEGNSNKFQNKMYALTGNSSQSNVTSLDDASAGTLSSDQKSFTWTFSSTDEITYFKLLSNEKFTSGTVTYCKVIITYEKSTTQPTTYSITVTQPEEGGTISANLEEAAENATVTLTATPEAGYKLGNVTVTPDDNTIAPFSASVSGNTATFTMPASDVTVSATFTALPTYDITVTNGTASPTSAYEGQEVTLSPTIPEGQIVDWDETEVSPEGLEIDHSSYKFTMPGEDVAVTFAFKNAPTYVFYEPFTGSTGTNNDFGVSTSSDGNGTPEYCNLYGPFTTTETIYGANNAVKLGASKKKGNATTPTITGLESGKTYVLTFKAAPWGSESTTMNVTATGGTLSGVSTATMTNGQWNDYTATFVASSTEATFTFEASKNRFFLDEVMLDVAPTVEYNIYRTIQTNGENSSAGGWLGDWTNCTLPDGANGDGYVVTAPAGATVQFKAGTNNNYKILASHVTAVDANNQEVQLNVVSSDDSGITFSFTMPASAVTITANFTDYNHPTLRLAGRFNGRSESSWITGNNGPEFTFDEDKDEYTIDVYFTGAISDSNEQVDFFYLREGDNDLKASANGNCWVAENGGTYTLGGSSNFRIYPGVYTITVTGSRKQAVITKVTPELSLNYPAGEVLSGTTISATSNLADLIAAIQDKDNGAEGEVSVKVCTDDSSFDQDEISITSNQTVYGKAWIGNLVVPTVSAAYTVKEFETVEPTYTEAFSENFGKFFADNNTIWTIYNSSCAKASAYFSGSATASESWLYSPYIDLTESSNPQLSFSHAGNYFVTDGQSHMAEDVKVMVREFSNNEWSGWTALEGVTYPEGNSFDFVDYTTSLSAYVGKTIQVAFKYTSTTERAGTWEIKNFKVADVYTITCNTADNGTITASPNPAAEGETVTITVTPESGYELATLVYNDGTDHDIKATKSFTMPAANVTVTATFDEKIINTDDFVLVTDANQLVAGNEYIIVNRVNKMALGTYQKTANREAVSVTLSEDEQVATINDDIQVITLLGNEQDGWYLYTNATDDYPNGGYLYSPGSQKRNQLKTSEEIVDGALATISIATDTKATVAFQVPKENDYTGEMEIEPWYIRYNTSNDGMFSCYDGPSNQLDIWLYTRGEVTPTTPEMTLADICKYGVTTEGKNEYIIADKLQAVYAYTKGGNSLLWCKDLGNKSIVPTTIHSGQIDFMREPGINTDTEGVHNGQQGPWDQSNWIVLQFTNPTGSNNIDEMLRNAQDKFIKPGTIKGKLVDDENYILKMDLDQLELVTQADPDYDEEPYNENVYCPANFLPENLNIHDGIENGDGAQSGNVNYFFMNPKVQEICYITYAQWDNDLKYFSAPSSSGIDGAFQVGWVYQDQPALESGKIYKFHAVVHRVGKEYGPQNPVSTKDGMPVYANITVLPIDLTADSEVVTSINTVETGNGEVKSVKYVNVAGMVSDVPFQGVNIVVTEYTDGSRSTSKMLRK